MGPIIHGDYRIDEEKSEEEGHDFLISLLDKSADEEQNEELYDTPEKSKLHE